MNRSALVYFNDTLAGELRETDTGYEFAYRSEWLSHEDARPVSLTLPLRAEPYRSTTMFPFFDGLIPEGWLLAVTSDTWKVDRRDRMGLLLVACRDPIGAVHVRPSEPREESAP